MKSIVGRLLPFFLFSLLKRYVNAFYLSVQIQYRIFVGGCLIVFFFICWGFFLLT